MIFKKLHALSVPSHAHGRLHFYQPFFFLLFLAGASSPDVAEPPSWSLPRHLEPAPTIHSPFYGASTDDARGFSTVGCLARSPTLFCRGVTLLAWVTMELVMIILQTSLLLRKLKIQGPHRIEAHFDQDFSLILFICLYLFCFHFRLFYFIFILIFCI